MFNLFNRKDKKYKQTDDNSFKAMKPIEHTEPKWDIRDGDPQEIAMYVYNMIKGMDSSEKLNLEIKSVPNFRFEIVKKRI